MTAKEYLNQAYRLDQQISSKQEQIDALNDLATRCTASMTGMPHSPNQGNSSMADAICKIVDLQTAIANDMGALVDLKADIIRTISQVSNVEYRLILEKRYVTGKTWPEIAIDLGYKMRRMFDLHEEALAAIKIPEKNAAVQ
ncbi:MAG: hypothetical protein J6Q53_03730 [Oscillospiraceae bacterium]|nr:hypothetical protein [Oscillospiraceae bacterium]